MDRLKNHEGYHDPTACRAIRNVSRKRRRGQGKTSRRLAYRLEEIQGFGEWLDGSAVILK